MRSRFVRFRNLLVLFVSRHSTLNEIVREVYLQISRKWTLGHYFNAVPGRLF